MGISRPENPGASQFRAGPGSEYIHCHNSHFHRLICFAYPSCQPPAVLHFAYPTTRGEEKKRRLGSAAKRITCRKSSGPVFRLRIQKLSNNIHLDIFFQDNARPTDDAVARPSALEMNAPVSTSAGRSMPVCIPRPRNRYTTSSLATLPLAPFA